MSEKGYVDSFVAFIDVLGFKEFVKNNTFDSVISLFDNIKICLKIIPTLGNDIIDEQILKTVTYNIISDSIVISVPKTTKYSLEVLLYVVNLVVFDILHNYNLTCRGAIAEGDFYSEKDVAFGPALIDAYLLERDVAEYPRIIFTLKTVNLYQKISNRDLTKNSYLMYPEIDDELFIADYIGFSLFGFAISLKEGCMTNRDVNLILNKLKTNIENNLETQIDDKTIKKYLYLKDYYNKMISFANKNPSFNFKCNPIIKESKNYNNSILQNYSNNMISNSNNIINGNIGNNTNIKLYNKVQSEKEDTELLKLIKKLPLKKRTEFISMLYDELGEE